LQGIAGTKRMSNFRRRIIKFGKLFAIVLILAGVVYWIKFLPVPVSEERVQRGEVVAEVMGTGTLEAHFKTTISPRISGRLQEVLVDIGDSVAAGKILAKLDDVELKPQVEIAQASVAVSQATLTRLEADHAQALAVCEQAIADHRRALDLFPTKAISQSDFDKITADWKTAQAGVARADATLIEGRKQLIAAETTLAYRKALLTDTNVVAPSDGLIVQRQRNPGDIAVPGSAILTLISTQELWIAAWVDETEMAHVSVGQPAKVVFRSEPDHAYRGEVTRMVREADRETREFEVDVRVLELPKNWAIGQRSEVYIETARKTGVAALPTKDIFWRDGKPGVFVRQGQYAAWRDITLGIKGKKIVEIAAGLEPEELVVVPLDGKNTAVEGRRISLP
jgi:HlyD family secretion protein